MFLCAAQGGRCARLYMVTSHLLGTVLDIVWGGSYRMADRLADWSVVLLLFDCVWGTFSHAGLSLLLRCDSLSCCFLMACQNVLLRTVKRLYRFPDELFKCGLFAKVTLLNPYIRWNGWKMNKTCPCRLKSLFPSLNAVRGSFLPGTAIFLFFYPCSLVSLFPMTKPGVQIIGDVEQYRNGRLSVHPDISWHRCKIRNQAQLFVSLSKLHLVTFYRVLRSSLGRKKNTRFYF